MVVVVKMCVFSAGHGLPEILQSLLEALVNAGFATGFFDRYDDIIVTMWKHMGNLLVYASGRRTVDDGKVRVAMTSYVIGFKHLPEQIRQMWGEIPRFATTREAYTQHHHSQLLRLVDCGNSHGIPPPDPSGDGPQDALLIPTPDPSGDCTQYALIEYLLRHAGLVYADQVLALIESSGGFVEAARAILGIAA